MRPRTSLILVLLILLICSPAIAYKHSAKFMLGSYSYMRSTFSYTANYKDEIARYLRTLGYNSTLVETVTNERGLTAILNELDAAGIDAVIWDRSWSIDPGNPMHYSVGPLSTSNYLKLEAEYSGPQGVKSADRNNSKFWYASHNEASLPRVGRAEEEDDASNGHIWKVTKENDPGYIYTDIKYRWPNRSDNYTHPGSIWNLYQTKPPNYEDHFFYIRYRVKIENLDPGAALSDTLLSFVPEGYPIANGAPSRQSRPVLHSSRELQPQLSLSSSLTVGQLKSNPHQSGYITIELKIPYREMINAGLLTNDLDYNPDTAPSDTMLRMISLNPRLYWHGNCDVSLDYIEVEDQTHYNLRTDPERYRTGLYNRVTQILEQSPGNISALYSFDEPYQTNFDSYRLLQDYLADTGIDYYTATYDYLSTSIALDRSAGEYYDHLSGFRQAANPRIVAPDIYPIGFETEFNRPGSVFIQTLLDTKLHKAYLDSKLYSMQEDGRKFYPIVQTFGRWARYNNGDQWVNWLQVPYATQKVLNYLPLCYGADGIYHYRFQSYQSPEGYGDYSAMKVFSRNGVYEPAVENPIIWNAIRDSNPKVKFYGELLQDMIWNGTQTFGTGNSTVDSAVNASAIRTVNINPEEGVPYSGYIQAGFYSDSEGQLNLLTVNRRGNFFQPGFYTKEMFVAPDSIAAYYPQANSQNLNLEMNSRQLRGLGKYPGFYDPADHSWFMIDDARVSIPLEAGEARLLQLTGCIPDGMRGSNVIKSSAFVDGEINLAPKAKLTINKDAVLRLAPGAVLRLGRRAKLILKGRLELGEGARIEPSSAILRRRGSCISPAID